MLDRPNSPDETDCRWGRPFRVYVFYFDHIHCKLAETMNGDYVILQHSFHPLIHRCIDLAIVTASTTVTATREKGLRQMGVDLFGHGGAGFNWHGWRHCLEIAEKFGGFLRGLRPRRGTKEGIFFPPTATSNGAGLISATIICRLLPLMQKP
jgi:hypothetical protein